ncbi:hypothetical protein MASR2M47_04110 [Draconibacterium sp.]|jgi:hypothetical protein
MKTREKINYGFESKQDFQRNYSFTSNDFRIQQIRNQGFIVPWHVVDKGKEKFLVE